MDAVKYLERARDTGDRIVLCFRRLEFGDLFKVHDELRNEIMKGNGLQDIKRVRHPKCSRVSAKSEELLRNEEFTMKCSFDALHEDINFLVC